jgi:DNA polymerase III epsilon subunit-like protein
MFCLWDYETCHLNLRSETNRPWQLAYIVADQKKIHYKKDHYLWWDDLEVSPEAARITGFNRAAYEKRAEDPRKVLKEFRKVIHDENIRPAGHNILGFDVYIEATHARGANMPVDYSYVNRLIDTNCLEKAIVEEIPYNKNTSFIGWQYSLANFRKRGLKTNLQQCAKRYGIEFDASKLHDALYDIGINLEVLKKQLWKIEI